MRLNFKKNQKYCWQQSELRPGHLLHQYLENMSFSNALFSYILIIKKKKRQLFKNENLTQKKTLKKQKQP